MIEELRQALRCAEAALALMTASETLDATDTDEVRRLLNDLTTHLRLMERIVTGD